MGGIVKRPVTQQKSGEVGPYLCYLQVAGGARGAAGGGFHGAIRGTNEEIREILLDFLKPGGGGGGDYKERGRIEVLYSDLES